MTEKLAPQAERPPTASIRPENEVRSFAVVDELPPAPPLPAKASRLRGREKGSRREQRSISRVRNSLAMMLERNADKYDAWFTKAAEQNPMKALILMKDLAEYFMPKLGRIEQTGTVEHKVSHFVPITEREQPPALEGTFTTVEPPK